jgi:hypothetical protein
VRGILTRNAITRAILLTSFKALGAIRAIVLTAGLAAITAVAASWLMRLVTGGSRLGWVSPLQVFGLEVAATFLIAAFGTSALMPRISDASRAEPGSRRASPIVQVLLTALIVGTLVQVTLLSTWWEMDRALLAQATGTDGNALSLRLIPAVVLFSLPTLAALALVTFLLTSVVGMLARAELTFLVLAACVFLQAGLVVGEQLLLNAMATLGATVLDAIAQSRDVKAAEQVADWLARHEAAASELSWRLVWILGAYVVTAAVSGLIAPRERRSVAARADASRAFERVPLPAIAATGSTAVPPVVMGPAVAPVSPERAGVGTAFPHHSYSVRPRQNFVDFFLRSYSTYDIASIPPSLQSRFTFSWKSGTLRREPNGPALVAIRRTPGKDVLGRRSYQAANVASGAILGTLRPSGREWEIIDAAGTSSGRIVEEKSGIGYITYVATVNGSAVCRFTWAMQGLTVTSSGLDVEFEPAADRTIDRAFAIAIAPVLEHAARRASGWRR